MYPPDLVEAVLSHADIVDVISSYLNVIKKGKSFRAVCPFHDDTDPSLMISREKQIFNCFVCRTGGNAITFVKRYENCSFDEAVRKVAEISSFSDPRLLKEVKIVKVDPSIEPIYKCINDLQKYYMYGLSIPEAENARKYLENRGITPEIIQKYGVGFSPLDGEATVKFLTAKGHSLKAIEGTGIAFADTKSRDCNAGRITFPLCDPYGQVIGYSARRIIEDDSGKYINSPEGPIFHKSSVLYNYHRAKDIARREKAIYVLEGFMDVIALDKAGISNAVAIMGTALTSDQITLIKRLNCELRLCLDGDGPGQKAMMKLIPELQKANVEFRIVSNPGDLRDADEILNQDGKEKLVQMMNNLVDPFQFQLSFYLNTKKLETIQEKKVVLSYFAPIIGNIKDPIERDDYVAKLSKATGFETSTIYKEIDRKTPKGIADDDIRFTSQTMVNIVKRTKFDRLNKAEEHILFYMLKELSAIKFFDTQVKSFFNSEFELIANYILDYYSAKNEIPTPAVLLGNMEANGEEQVGEISDILSKLLSKEKLYPPYSHTEIEAIFKVLETERLKAFNLKKLEDSLANATPEEKTKAINEYIKSKSVEDKIKS